MLCSNFFRGGVELPRSAVVAKAFPQTQYFNLARGGETVDIGKHRNEPREVVARSRDLRLLEHDLADPHAIRILRLTPRQVAGVFSVPGEKTSTQRLLLR